MYFSESQLLCAVVLCQLVSSQGLAAWHTSVGPQVVYQNSTSGDLYYSLDTGSGSGIGGFTPSAKILVTVTPKQGTALAGAGYTDSSGVLQGQIFYISTTNSIVEATIACTLPNGTCVLTGMFTISNALTTGINNSTALSVALRTATDGYRVFYHDSAGRTRQIQYSGPLNITWGDGAPVFNYTSESPGLATDSGVNLSAYAIDSNGDVLTGHLWSNGTWQGLSQPQNMTAWDPRNVTLAATDNPSTNLRRLFYIGSDRSLHEMDSPDNGYAWIKAPQQPTSIWPLADDPNAFFAAATSIATTTFFYFSNGDLVKTALDNGIWQKAVAIFGNSSASTTMPTIPVPTDTSTPTSLPSENSNTSSKVAVGIGTGVGILLLAAIFVLVLLLVGKLRRARQPASVFSTKSPRERSVISEGGPQEVHAQPIHYELGEGRQHELTAEGNGIISPIYAMPVRAPSLCKDNGIMSPMYVMPMRTALSGHG